MGHRSAPLPHGAIGGGRALIPALLVVGAGERHAALSGVLAHGNVRRLARHSGSGTGTSVACPAVHGSRVQHVGVNGARVTSAEVHGHASLPRRTVTRLYTLADAVSLRAHEGRLAIAGEKTSGCRRRFRRAAAKSPDHACGGQNTKNQKAEFHSRDSPSLTQFIAYSYHAARP